MSNSNTLDFMQTYISFRADFNRNKSFFQIQADTTFQTSVAVVFYIQWVGLNIQFLCINTFKRYNNWRGMLLQHGSQYQNVEFKAVLWASHRRDTSAITGRLLHKKLPFLKWRWGPLFPTSAYIDLNTDPFSFLCIYMYYNASLKSWSYFTLKLPVIYIFACLNG